MSKQKIKKPSLIERSKAEYHPEGYNWNGPFTQNMERMSLNFKGKVGTESYFLPANKLDLSAFLHDLQYFSPSPIARAYADNQYYTQNIEKSKKGLPLVSKAFIWSAWAGRTLKELAKIGISAKFIKDQILTSTSDWFKFYKSLWIPTGLGVGLEDVPSGMGEGSIPSARVKFNPKGFYLPSYLFGKYGKIPEPYRTNLNEWFMEKFGKEYSLTTARGAAYKKRFLPLAMRTLSLYLLYGSKYSPQPLKGLDRLNKLTLKYWTESEEYKELDSESKKVYDSYLKYLDTVGSFNKDGDFVIKDNINEKEAKKTYTDYYKQSKKYFGWVNEYYKDYPDFKGYVQGTYPKNNKWVFPKLNKNMLDNVANPLMVKPPPIKIPPEFKFDILEPYPVEKEKEKEDEDDEDDDFDIPEEEIMAILEGRQDKPFETPAEFPDKPEDLPDWFRD